MKSSSEIWFEDQCENDKSDVYQQRQKHRSENVSRWTNGGTSGTVQISDEYCEKYIRSITDITKKAFMDKK